MFLTSIERINETKLAISKISHCIDDLQMLGDENGFKTVMIIQPVSADLIINKSEKCKINKISPPNPNIKIIDMIEFFQTNNVALQIDDFYWPIDQHFTIKGNNLFASGLRDFIINKKILE